ncbi:hypothetical protein LJR034_005293 [Caballeronia sp. LjRoot34]|uniref:hypothetical protein n=1 Tax=Caballeronia sp. LjRoot34 TaxID=3342325 RepID=UPI003ED0C179
MANPIKSVTYPEWTERAEKAGQDPLGMQAACIAQYQELVPGISNVTLRMRYYGFYAWLADQYSKSITDPNPDTWLLFLRRGEALYALTAAFDGEEGGIAGSLWARRKLKATAGQWVKFSEDALPSGSKLYLRQKWGAYGAAYGSQLFETGILADAKEHGVPVPSHVVGMALAKEFGNALGANKDPFAHAIRRGSVSLTELRKFARCLPSNIKLRSREQTLYKKVLFDRLKIENSSGGPRKRTLELLLHLLQQNKAFLRPLEIRWILYSGFLPDGKEIPWAEDVVGAHRDKWWAYHANDLLHVCYECVLKYLLETLSRHPAGIAADELVGEAISKIFEGHALGNMTWGAFLDGLQLTNDASDVQNPESERSMLEFILGASTSVYSADIVFKALKLLGALIKRTGERPDLVNEEFAATDVAQTLRTERDYLASKNGDSVLATVERLITERILRRHLWVAVRKFRHNGDYTFLFEDDEGRLRKVADIAPTLTNPRLATSLAFLRDVRLVCDDGLTGDGIKELAHDEAI